MFSVIFSYSIGKEAIMRMNPVAAYQVAQSKQLVKKKMLSNPKMREKYIEEQRRKKKLEELEMKHYHDYWFNM